MTHSIGYINAASARVEAVPSIDLSSPLLHLRSAGFAWARLRRCNMMKGKTSKLKRAKKSGKAKKPSRTALWPGWIQGDFISSTMKKEDVLELVEHEMIAEKSWRLPEGDVEPKPHEGERVVLLTHVERDFSLPPHPFICGFLY